MQQTNSTQFFACTVSAGQKGNAGCVQIYRKPRCCFISRLINKHKNTRTIRQKEENKKYTIGKQSKK